MIKARHSSFFGFVFRCYLYCSFRRHFQKMEIINKVQDKGLPMLVVANHISWWDGFWALHLNDKLFKRKLHVMMLEEQLRKNLFLRRLGAFSICKNSRTMAESLGYAAGLLRNKNNMVVIYPQGEIKSVYEHSIVFNQGWKRMLEKNQWPVQVLFLVNLPDYFSGQKPTLRQYVASPEKNTNFSCQELESLYNDFYRQCLAEQRSIKC